MAPQRLQDVDDFIGGLGRTIIDALPAEVVVVNSCGAIIAFNEAWRRSMEASCGGHNQIGVGALYREACLGMLDSSAAAAHEVERGVEAVIAGERQRFAIDYLRTSPAGTHRWFALIVTPVELGDSSGSCDGTKSRRVALITQLDITDRKSADLTRLRRAKASLKRRAEKLLKLARDLQRTNSELDYFAYITSHDLRAPLRGIANLSRWIEEDMGDRFTPEAHEQMELLRGRVHRMESLIDGILRFCRAGRGTAVIEPVDMRRVVEEIIDLLSPPPGVQVMIETWMPMLRTQLVLIQQVVMNLISNAIKHGAGQAGNVWVGCQDRGEQVEFYVRDDGPGIDQRFHQKIFVMFQTLEPRDRVEGTGIGLALVKKIVEQQGGRVWIESADGAGATFRFTWPKSTAREWRPRGGAFR